MGRLQGDALAAQYAWADVLIVPSEREVWGLVVNEALANGLFVISSDEVASAIDLVPGSESGVTVPVRDQSALANALAEAESGLDRSESARLERRHAALDHAPAAYDPAAWATAAMKAARIADGQYLDQT